MRSNDVDFLNQNLRLLRLSSPTLSYLIAYKEGADSEWKLFDDANELLTKLFNHTDFSARQTKLQELLHPSIWLKEQADGDA